MLRVFLEVVDRQGSIRRTRLRACQELRIGSSQMADFVCNDPSLAAVHFRVYTDLLAAYLVTVDHHDVLINQQPATAGILADGDVIQAGSAVFRVRVEGDQPEKGVLVIPERADQFKADEPSIGPSSMFWESTCRSGLTKFTGSSAKEMPVALAESLTPLGSLHLIVDFHKLQMVAPTNSHEIVTDDSRTYNAGRGLPRLIAATGTEWPRYLKHGWGQNTVVTLLSASSDVQLLQHVRRCCCEETPEACDGGMPGVCWPSVLSGMLESQSEFVRRFFAGLNAVFVEVPGAPEQWQLYGKADVAQCLTDAGFVEAPMEGQLSA